ncbi:hypothetical protein ROZALSC1DRAFT_31477 [Rozella allomycis CSF55]|uniref:Uncharacterized protein n=1 Tax=Rozella allomycis (strain CSF55) TaxID=988480 RepID=A0A075B1X1_ROZAC|nr:hypothetical protein O9G_005847 [Rozella allomycis CSF55]RKP16617.1 hypothetical protein ROZALSC1DRAFT_31477 [Rozella allomycis CSF55]|eukprot:EPZ36365.1 hypothetical protein O9G_005847 [Rozella allomycis CSF55]
MLLQIIINVSDDESFYHQALPHVLELCCKYTRIQCQSYVSLESQMCLCNPLTPNLHT